MAKQIEKFKRWWSTVPVGVVNYRQQCRIAAIQGRPSSPGWPEVENAKIDHRRHQLLAESFGLDKTASWDDIYAAWCGRGDEVRAAIKSALIASVPGALLLLLWMNWATIVIAVIIFVMLFAFLQWSEMMVFAFINDEVYHTFPEIQRRAKRDGLG